MVAAVPAGDSSRACRDTAVARHSSRHLRRVVLHQHWRGRVSGALPATASGTARAVSDVQRRPAFRHRRGHRGDRRDVVHRCGGGRLHRLRPGLLGHLPAALYLECVGDVNAGPGNRDDRHVACHALSRCATVAISRGGAAGGRNADHRESSVCVVWAHRAGHAGTGVLTPAVAVLGGHPPRAARRQPAAAGVHVRAFSGQPSTGSRFHYQMCCRFRCCWRC